MLKFLYEIFGLQNLSEDFIKYVVYGLLGSIFWRLIKKMNGWQPTLKKEAMFWGISLPMMFVIVGFASSLTARPKGGFHAGYISIAAITNPIMKVSVTNFPTASVTMSGVGGGAPEKLQQPGADLALIVKIDNSGPPSVAWDWKVTVTIPGGSKFEGVLPATSMSQGAGVETIIGMYYFKPEENLIQAFATNPLSTGAGKIGWLFVHVPGLIDIPQKSVVRLSFRDVFKRETKVEYEWDAKK